MVIQCYDIAVVKPCQKFIINVILALIVMSLRNIGIFKIISIRHLSFRFYIELLCLCIINFT